jgi:copper chaperone
MTDKTVNGPDMTCGHCKAAGEGEFSKLSGYRRSTPISSERDTVEVSDDDEKVTPDDLRGAIEEAGYTVAA